ncbi:MAG: glycosyltransferase family 39 protein [Caldilineaceae bacterium]|nr:glycosyltransferase family 39 protein [Caldilineaceae bacterium]
MLAQILARRNRLVLLLIVLLGAALRFFLIGTKTIWLDEAFSIWIAQHSLWEGWRWLVKIDQHPPLYYSLLSLWQALFGDAQGVVRAFSALCSTATLPFMYLAAKRITRDEITALLATLILAVAPFHVRFAQETRMYALLTLLAAMALYCAALYLGGYGTRRLTWRDWVTPVRWRRLHDVRAAVGLALAQAGVMLTHNTAAVFFPLALNVAVLGALAYQRSTGRYVSLRAVNSPRFGRNWAMIQGVAFLLWLPWAVPFVLQARLVDGEFWIQAPTLRTIAGTLKTFSFAHLPDWLPAVPFLVLYALLALAGLFYFRKRMAWALLLLSLCVVPFVGELLVSLRRPIFYDRTLIWTTLPFYLLMAIGIRGVMVGAFGPGKEERFPARAELSTHPGEMRARQVIAGLAVAVILSLSGVSLFNYYTAFQKEEWATAAAYVAERAEPGDMLVFNATWVQLPFAYYFRHYDTATELHGAPVDLFDRGVLEPKMTEADVPHLRALVADADRVWLVYSHEWYTDPDGIIQRELGTLMQQTDRESFEGLQVLTFARP